MAKAAPVKKSPAKTALKPAAAAKKPVTATRKKTTRAVPSTVKKAAPAKKTTAAKKKIAGKTAPGKGTGNIIRYKCRLCGYIYSPLRGEPHNGIPAGTAFEDLPDSYVCPVCGMEGKGRVGKWGFDEWQPTRYLCTMCDYIYDEKRGEPHRGIKPGTKFRDLPDDYVCPVCATDPRMQLQFGNVFKSGFEPLNI